MKEDNASDNTELVTSLTTTFSSPYHNSLSMIKTLSSAETANTHVTLCVCRTTGHIIIVKEHLLDAPFMLPSYALVEILTHMKLSKATLKTNRLQQCCGIVITPSTCQIHFKHVPHNVCSLYGASRVPTNVVRNMVTDVVKALLQLRHVVGAAHRDVKLANLCIDARGRTILIDMDSCDIGPFSSSSPISTITVRAPELLLLEIDIAAEPVDVFSADVWSVGMCWAELLLNRQIYTPYDWSSPQRMYAAATRFAQALTDVGMDDDRVTRLKLRAGQDYIILCSMINVDPAKRPKLDDLLEALKLENK